MGRVWGGTAGALFYLWIAGVRALNPGEIGWLMRYDWPVHFFGWHFFRNEPWRLPPGLIEGYYAPLGTAIGFTDSIPLVAFALKPIANVLPATFQYIGAWLFLCFVLQGWFGAWLASRWTTSVSLQVCAAALFVLMPVLLIRIGHPALCSHWLLLWTLVIAARQGAARVRPLEWGAIGLCAGLIHPYLAVMVLGLLGAVAITPAGIPFRTRARAIATALGLVIGGWWAAGLFSVSGAESMATIGLGHFSMNLLGPFTPAGWSTLLPDLPRATDGQDYEGFQYLGVGTLLLLPLAGFVLLRRPGPSGKGGRSWPGFGAAVIAVAVAMALVALSPRITFGSSVLLDVTGPLTDRLAVFRATGRFFWPLGYWLLASALGVVITRLPSRVALSLLLTIVTLQAVDLHGAHEQRRRSARDPGFYVWSSPMTSPIWHEVLPKYDHLVLYPPPQCGRAPIAFEAPAYLAGLHRLTLNAGGVARPDEAARDRYCHQLGDDVQAGRLDDRTLYIVAPSETGAIRSAARPPAVCGTIDAVAVCATAASYEAWRQLAPLN